MTTSSPETAFPGQPDIVLIHAHDLGTWLSCYPGFESVPSPNLDRFAAESIVFDHTFSAAPLCSPARGSLFTGLSPHEHGVLGLTHHAWRYRQGVVTLPELLRPLGYRSTLVGLQHENVDPSVLGFDQVLGVGFLPRARSVVSEATQWLRNRPEQGPFLLTVGTWEVHRPWPAEDYPPADPGSVTVPQYLPDNADTRSDIAAFHGSIRQLDSAVGELLDAIDETCDPARTLIIFTTDHGAAFPGAKGTLYDRGTNVAFIVRPPTSWGISPGRRAELVSHLDVVPSLVELAGGQRPDSLVGQSILPVLRQEQTDHRVLFSEKDFHDAYDPIRAIRSADYKYIRNYADGPRLLLSKDLEQSPTRRGMGDEFLQPRPAEELYDLRSDPGETDNRADDPAYANIREQFAAQLTEWMRRTHDPVLAGPIPPAPPRSRAVDALPPLLDNADAVPGGSA